MNVLLDEDVARECAIPEPVAKAVFIRSFAFALLLGRCRRVVVAGDCGDLSQSAGPDLLGQSRDGRSVAALEADIDALIRLHALGDFESLPRLRDVDAHRLLAIDMLAGGDRCLEMLHVKKRRRRDLDQIDVGRSCQLFVGVRAFE